MNYYGRIWEGICHYEARHGQQPNVIFMSTALLCKLAREHRVECWADEPFTRLCGIPVQTYASSHEEYYLAEGAYCFE
jgi:hypothetical protein